MKVKVLKTTDKKFEGKVFEIDSFTPEEAESIIGIKFDFKQITQEGEIVTLQSEHFTAKLKILES